MLIINKTDIQTIFPMADAIAACKDALRLYAEGKSTVPLRTHIEMTKSQGQSLFMPAFVDDINALGVKMVSIFPNNIAHNKPTILSQMIVLDGTTGEVNALIDGTYLTQLRTGALQGAATDLLARPNATKAVLIGTGSQAETQLEAMLMVRKLKEIYIVGRDFNKTQSFANAMQKKFSRFNTHIIASKNADSVTHDADIITTATSSLQPVFNGELVKAGTHINGIGSYTPLMQELPEYIIRHADKIIFDTKEGVLAEAGDILIPLHAGKISEANFTGDLGDVILGKIKGRQSDTEITVFKSVGSAVFDVVSAQKIYQQALNANVGLQIS